MNEPHHERSCSIGKPRRPQMSTDRIAGPPRQDQAWVTAGEWFAGGERVPYDRESARVLTEEEAAATAGALRVFERVSATEQDADTVWLTLLPGYPDGSYGWAQVDRMLGDDLGPRLYVEPVGQGDSDKPRAYPDSTGERADLVEALWRHHGVRRTVVVTFDYTAIALLELLRRQLEQTTSGDPGRPAITAALMVNGGLFADAHTHPWQSTPLLGTQLGALAMRLAQRSPRVFTASMLRARLYSGSYHPDPGELAELRWAITRRDGAAFLHNAAGFVKEHRRYAQRWDLAAIARDLEGTVALYVGGSEEDAYEHRQIAAARERVPQAKVALRTCGGCERPAVGGTFIWPPNHDQRPRSLSTVSPFVATIPVGPEPRWGTPQRSEDERPGPSAVSGLPGDGQTGHGT
jgi:pimeloyl-ACP methyl ester carboxylesterase